MVKWIECVVVCVSLYVRARAIVICRDSRLLSFFSFNANAPAKLNCVEKNRILQNTVKKMCKTKIRTENGEKCAYTLRRSVSYCTQMVVLQHFTANNLLFYYIFFTFRFVVCLFLLCDQSLATFRRRRWSRIAAHRKHTRSHDILQYVWVNTVGCTTADSKHTHTWKSKKQRHPREPARYHQVQTHSHTHTLAVKCSYITAAKLRTWKWYAGTERTHHTIEKHGDERRRNGERQTKTDTVAQYVRKV